MGDASKKSYYIHLLCTIGIVGMFAITSLLLIYVSRRIYTSIVDENTKTYSLRTSLSYIAEKIRQADEEGCIYMERKEGMDLLVMKQTVKGQEYETLIYFYHGALYEAVHKNGEGFSLSQGAYGCQVMKVHGFVMAEITNRLLQFTAIDDSGREESMIVNLRSRR